MTTATLHSPEAIAREILRRNGCTDPHPSLLEDTIREVEYHGATMPETTEVWEVVKQDWEIECQHPYCDTFHQHLFNADYADGSQMVTIYSPKTDEPLRTEWHAQYHMTTRTEWVVLHNGERVGDAHATKREATAEMGRLQR